MRTTSRRAWLFAAAVVAGAYLVIGLGIGALAGAAGSEQLRFAWRLGAFVVSGIAFVAHLAYEHMRLGSRPRATAFHTAAAVAAGAFGLAVAAVLHPHDPALSARLGLSLVLWPLIAGVPALLVALVLSAGLSRVRRGG